MSKHTNSGSISTDIIDPHQQLSSRERMFVAALATNQFNMVKAYQSIEPTCKSKVVAMRNAQELRDRAGVGDAINRAVQHQISASGELWLSALYSLQVVAENSNDDYARIKAANTILSHIGLSVELRKQEQAAQTAEGGAIQSVVGLIQQLITHDQRSVQPLDAEIIEREGLKPVPYREFEEEQEALEQEFEEEMRDGKDDREW